MKLDVCGIPFSVIDQEDGYNDFDKFGEISCMKAVIRLNKTCSPEQREATLVHEFLHGVLLCNGVAHNEDAIGVLATELYRQGFRVKVEG